MGQHGDKARHALMDAAEELFARYGIDAVSNRRITEHAGTANHSAVAYHFGSRDELILALLDRHLAATELRRTEQLSAMGGDPGLHELVAVRILPVVETMAALPVPSWRARFLRQARSVPSVMSVLASRANAPGDFDALVRYLPLAAGEDSRRLMQARFGLISFLVSGVCAEYEARLDGDVSEGSWIDVGYFLVDSVMGLLTAPATHPSSYLPRSALPDLI